MEDLYWGGVGPEARSVELGIDYRRGKLSVSGLERRLVFTLRKWLRPMIIVRLR